MDTLDLFSEELAIIKTRPTEKNEWNESCRQYFDSEVGSVHFF
jgi:hypothetical protein